VPVPPSPALIGTSLLAWRNLSHDRARFIVTLIGVGFAVLLMGVELGLLVGFARTTSGLVDHSRAALWITPAGTTNVDIAGRLDERRRFQALAVPGVASVGKLMLQFGFWKKPDGGNESVALVGFEIESDALQPWNLVEGRIADLQQQDAVIIDRLYADKLGVKAIGDTIEINSQRARVVGFTRGLRTFTQSPYVGLEPGADVEVVRHALGERLGRVDVWKRADFARQAQKYWLITTGAGSALLLSALLGLVVGIVIVGQTLYATTVDRLPEYATLRAMGAPASYLNRVILKQAAISAAFGFSLGTLAAYVIVPWWLLVVLAALTVLMCAFGALISIRRLVRIDPSSVFA
jgi:putative ABC transport system permease protein